MTAKEEILQSLRDATGLQLSDDHLTILIASAVVFLTALFVWALTPRKAKRKYALDPESWTKFQMVKKEHVSHNSRRFRFALQTEETILGLPIGQHISIQGVDEEGKEFSRPYTPTTLDDDVGHFELVIKVYPQGKMSQCLEKLSVGTYVPFKGPKGRFTYTSGQVREFGMLAGGTGITPMFQVLKFILKDPSDNTKVKLIYANISLGDILLKDELDSFAKLHPNKFSIYYVLNDPPPGWTGGVGFVSADMIKAHLPAPAEDVKILRCGPPPMNKAMAAHLDALGYSKEMQFQF
ncbi:NADH-cytochrome b-5 reductase [Klebsormidium nitens]|uniref:NADH-cytochrome b5 reductase n=1 Tax=Klebsormidium nitens TaxID=105231 RepID=A0A1Y1I6N9_KLENI|nr:NADH-cytochrome b-5 reductase [Klebsormidium nitens]|eukprot:GAQ86614.1 NADH-cytochrome b-5 reductase [Klebsormidium nitens]